jgi:hypothetical protein
MFWNMLKESNPSTMTMFSEIIMNSRNSKVHSQLGFHFQEEKHQEFWPNFHKLFKIKNVMLYFDWPHLGPIKL